MESEIRTVFYIHPHIYYNTIDNNSFLLYDTKTGKHIEGKSETYCKIINEVYKPQNLGSICIDEELKDNEIESFIQELILSDFGGIEYLNSQEKTPINLLPVLNLQRDIDRMRIDKEFSVGEDSLNYLNELTIFIIDECNLQCPYCEIYIKQTKSCYKSNLKPSNQIELSIVKKLLDSISFSPIQSIHILGGNIFLYSKWKELTELFSMYGFTFHLWGHYTNWSNPQTELSQNVIKDVIVTFPLKDDFMDFVAKETDCQYHFFIENISQYEYIQNIIPHLKNYSIIPIYTEKNVNFFEDNVFLTKDDILTNAISYQTIFCNQKLNSNNFGKIYVSPNGNVQAGLNTSVIGNLHKSSLIEIVFNELDKNTSWRKTRSEKPCNKCLYQYLCPPMSNYEGCIGRNNLCHIGLL